MEYKNCWESKRCGREPGGKRSSEFGICPAAIDVINTGINHGQSSGRYCWVVSGTFCDGLVSGTFAKLQISCMHCEFFKAVHEEEGKSFVFSASIPDIAPLV